MRGDKIHKLVVVLGMLRQFKEELNEGPIGEIWYRTQSRTSCRERVVVFVVLPLVLIAVAALPQNIQQSWTLYLSSPSLTDAYLTNFVHHSFFHVSNNLIAYVFLMAVLLPLAIFADWKRELYITTLFFLAAVPFVVSYYTVWTLHGTGVKMVVGFSGVVAALLGLLPILLFAFFQRTVSSNIHVHYGLTLVALELAVIVFSWSGISIVVIALVILGALGLGVVMWDTRGDWEPLLSSNANIFLVLITFLTFIFVSYSILVDVGPGVNVYGHLIGFLSGFLFPGILSLVLDFRERFARNDAQLNLAL